MRLLRYARNDNVARNDNTARNDNVLSLRGALATKQSPVIASETYRTTCPM